MSYCKKEDNASIVTWQWGNDSPRKLTSSIVPIDVIFSREASADSMGTWSMITFDNVTTSSHFEYTGTSLESPVSLGREIRAANTNRYLYSDVSFFAGAIRFRNVLFTPNTPTGYKIKILDTTGKLLFEDFKVSDTPPTYMVACGKECPKGFCKCIIPEYPGYCCLDCGATASQIRAITNSLRGKND